MHEELKKRLKGIFHLQMTPFDENENLDLNALQQGIRHTLTNSKGQDLVFLAGGTTAEFFAMDDDEFIRYAEAFVKEVNGEHPVFVGTGSGSTKKTIETALFAQKIGADGVLVLPPFYMSATEDDLFAFYKEISDSIDIGIMLYNNPTTTKLWLNPSLLTRISKLDNVLIDKENAASPMAYYRITKSVNSEDMLIFTGLGYEQYQYLAPLGDCVGYASELVNFVPEAAFGIYKAGRDRDFANLKKHVDFLEPYRLYCDKLVAKRKVPYVVGPLVASAHLCIYQAIIKEIMNILGIPCGKVRKPTSNLNQEEKQELELLVKQLELQ